MSRLKFWALTVLVHLLTLYVGSYFYLSRRAFAEGDAMGYKALYFFPPQPTREWERQNFACVWFYWPLIMADCRLGTGREPGSAPLFNLQK